MKCFIANAAFIVYQRPSELQRKIPGASRRTLNVQLKELEIHGLVGKIIGLVVLPKVGYFLSEFGKLQIPIIGATGQ